MSEIEKYNQALWEAFQQTKEYKESKVICILFGNPDTTTQVFQTSQLTPHETATIMKAHAETMLKTLN